MVVGMGVAVIAAFMIGQKIAPQIERQPIVLPVFQVEVVEKRIELPVPGVPGACRLIDSSDGMTATRSYDCVDYLLFRRGTSYQMCDKKGERRCRSI